MPFCWFCHVAAQLILAILQRLMFRHTIQSISLHHTFSVFLYSYNLSRDYRVNPDLIVIPASLHYIIHSLYSYIVTTCQAIIESIQTSVSYQPIYTTSYILCILVQLQLVGDCRVNPDLSVIPASLHYIIHSLYSCTVTTCQRL